MTRSFFNQLFPHSLCRRCGAPSLGQILCVDCEKELPNIHLTPNAEHKHKTTHYCEQCSLPLSSPCEKCAECMASPPPFSKTFAAFVYTDPINHWIHNFKYRSDLRDGKLLSKSLINTAEQHAPLPDLLVPVPMPWIRLLIRGFNQAAWLSHQLSNHFNIPSLQTLKYKHPFPKRQAASSNSSRRSTHLNRFQLIERYKPLISGKRIVLIDDVMTTGSTAREISKILKDSGASSVDLWIIARTAKPKGKSDINL